MLSTFVLTRTIALSVFLVFAAPHVHTAPLHNVAVCSNGVPCGNSQASESPSFPSPPLGVFTKREKNIAFEHLENLPQEDPDPTGVVVDEERRTCWSVAICRRDAEAAITDGEPFQGEDELAVTTANM